MHRLLATIFATTAWLTTTPVAHAQAIEPVEHQLVLGQPPVLRLQVRGFEIDPARLGPDCIQVRLIQGDAEMPADATQVHTTPLAEDGKVLVRVTHPAEVHEPVLRARVQLSCGADYAREITLLVDPPVGPTLPRNTRPAAGQGVVRASSPLAARPVAASPVAAAVNPPARSSHVAAAPTRAATATREGARLSLEEPPLDRLVSAVLTALAQRQPELLRPAVAARDHGLRPVEADWLRELQRMQEEQRQSRAQLAALQLRLERQESDTLQRWGAIAATAGGVLAGALLLRIARERLLPRLSDLGRAGQRANSRTPSAEPEVSPGPNEVLRDPAPWLDAGPAAASSPMPWPESGAGSAGKAPAPMHTPHCATPDPPLAPGPPGPGSTPGPAAAKPPRQWPGADFGEASLAGNGHAPAVKQVDRMIADGYLGAAATILENALQARPGKSPWLLLRLLDIYRAMDQPWNHERVSAQLEALYNLRVPPMGLPTPVGQHAEDEGQTLEDRPDLLERLTQLWAQPPATMDWLRARLLRDRGLPAVDLATFRDLLCLYDLARQLDEPSETA